jgi:hypothetical protein
VAGSLQAPAHHVGMWRLADGQFEFSGEVRRASTRNRTEIPDVNGAVQIAVDESSHAKDLPSRLTTSCEAMSARTTVDLGLQDVRCRDQRRHCCLAIAVEFASRRLKELRQTFCPIVKWQTSCSRWVRCVGLKAFRELIYSESHVPLRRADTKGLSRQTEYEADNDRLRVAPPDTHSGDFACRNKLLVGSSEVVSSLA